MKRTAIYRGDGVYANKNELGEIELRANDYWTPTDTIFLDRNTLTALANFADGSTHGDDEDELKRRNAGKL